MKREKYVIIGGDAAGMTAAGQIRKLQPKSQIVVYERSPHTSYSACGMPYLIGGLVENDTKLIVRTPEEFMAKKNIEAFVFHEVLSVDIKARTLEVLNIQTGKLFTESFDSLLFATGAEPIRPPIEGIDGEGVFSLSVLQDGLRLQRFIEENNPQKAVIVGGGYIGLEMAEAFCRRGMNVSLVDRSFQVMNTFDIDMADHIADAIQHVGTSLYLGETLKAIEYNNNRIKAAITDQRNIPADIVILGLGVRPHSKLAKEAGLPLGVNDSILVNQMMETEIEDIWAAGDCAQTWHLVTNKPFWVALGSVANKTGRIAGINMAGGKEHFPGVVGTAVSKHCDLEVARTGLSEKELEDLDFHYETVTIKSKVQAGYYPGAGDIHVKMIAEVPGGRVLGAQIVGAHGAAKRIDVVATAISAQMTVRQLIDLDLGYAPPFSLPWDPIQIAARQLL
ncbi:MAG: FAD-dependent oxidoreductase [Aminobacterium sp.]|uniref:FAD-dependent oxidoreductase n=1 Tax=Aminobacterium sp. TaxID=1872491 RepID=UPI002B2206F4|nr:FAD-dependent oxidoreductase [Aminobacterium sp.]MEA4878194.1 FAD-dependent oxidoreductase [Aminobacterium sp.]